MHYSILNAAFFVGSPLLADRSSSLSSPPATPLPRARARLASASPGRASSSSAAPRPRRAVSFVPGTRSSATRRRPNRPYHEPPRRRLERQRVGASSNFDRVPSSTARPPTRDPRELAEDARVQPAHEQGRGAPSRTEGRRRDVDGAGESGDAARPTRTRPPTPEGILIRVGRGSPPTVDVRRRAELRGGDVHVAPEREPRRKGASRVFEPREEEEEDSLSRANAKKNESPPPSPLAAARDVDHDLPDSRVRQPKHRRGGCGRVVATSAGSSTRRRSASAAARRERARRRRRTRQ